MTNDNLARGHHPDVSAEAMERLATFADWTQTTPPKMILDAEGAPSDGFLAYCVENGLSLDWVFCGDAMPLVMESFHRARRASA